MPDGKYKVFKTETIDELLLAFSKRLTPEVGEALNNLLSAEIPDAVVIRRQDVFAPPALDAYANAILTGVEIAKHSGADIDNERVAALSEVATFFHEQAVLSWNTNRKFPD